ncbi:hypothetical protein PsAD2_01197 [Pseudovibrio axinellae]|uniref:Uncharacterized protein n=1 Tax=Pseudovibrio axinellae TaxID=989403 RepID=A0A166A807_9HYPH|nr:hypothetical protein [Pseudovibrio axinellae]KZL20709.1 hypothetical protein PsAD2_01197 [Pseudovibrio axinellae]SER25067.1 hypothetical protein SAMN05421798_107180 [Pseudovibrio axinellae]
MKRTTASILGLGALALVASPAFADDHDESKAVQTKVEFTELSLVDGSPDDGTCKTRYESGYTATDKGKNDAGQTKAVTDKGHDILITETDGTEGEGIYALTNSFEIVFPDSEQKDPVELQMFAAGLLGESPVVGVFSDGTCRGRITIHSK